MYISGAYYIYPRMLESLAKLSDILGLPLSLSLPALINQSHM